MNDALLDTRIGKCVAATPKATADSCARTLALDGRDLAYCAKITAPDLRQSCIVAVATNLKKPEACSAFSLSTDRQFCAYYSRGS